MHIIKSHILKVLHKHLLILLFTNFKMYHYNLHKDLWKNLIKLIKLSTAKPELGITISKEWTTVALTVWHFHLAKHHYFSCVFIWCDDGPQNYWLQIFCDFWFVRELCRIDDCYLFFSIFLKIREIWVKKKP